MTDFAYVIPVPSEYPEADEAIKTLCDICVDPGACCHGFTLTMGENNAGNWPTATQANVMMATHGMPFLAIPPEEGSEADAFRFVGPMLGRDGRCTIYDNRPDTCRRYEPASDGLCMRPWIPWRVRNESDRRF